MRASFSILFVGKSLRRDRFAGRVHRVFDREFRAQRGSQVRQIVFPQGALNDVHVYRFIMFPSGCVAPVAGFDS